MKNSLSPRFLNGVKVKKQWSGLAIGAALVHDMRAPHPLHRACALSYCAAASGVPAFQLPRTLPLRLAQETPSHARDRNDSGHRTSHGSEPGSNTPHLAAQLASHTTP